jgi:hypothetical protein
MNYSNESTKIAYAVHSLKEGVILFVKNLHILVPVLAIMLLSYFFIVFAVLAVIPAEKIGEITEKYGSNPNSEAGEEIFKEISGYLSQNLAKTLSIFFLFGLAVFILQEFSIAGIAACSLELSRGNSISISKFLEKAFIYTLRIVQIDLIAVLLVIALFSPFILLFYLNLRIIEVAISFVLAFILLVTTFAKFYAIEDVGIFDSLAKGTGFLFRNIFAVVFLFLAWFVISFPLAFLSLLFPPFILLVPALLLLFYILMAKYYVVVSAESITEF